MSYRPKSDEREVKIFVTKYALTTGITKVSGTTRDGKYVHLGRGAGGWTVGPSEWVATKEEAIAKFDRLRSKRIKSLKKSLAKIEAMTEPTFKEREESGR